MGLQVETGKEKSVKGGGEDLKRAKEAGGREVGARSGDGEHKGFASWQVGWAGLGSLWAGGATGLPGPTTGLKNSFL